MLVLAPHQLFSLWEMIPFLPLEFYEAKIHIESLIHEYRTGAEKDADRLTDNEKDALLRWVDQIEKQAKKCELEHTLLNVADIKWKLDFHEVFDISFNKQILADNLAGMLNALCGELEKKKFAFIPADKAQYFERNDLFGEEVKEACSDEVNAEIKDAGNCLAADLNTAAVFHLMLVAEHGMRALATHMKVKLKKIPTKEAGWAKLISEIKKRIDQREARNEKRQSKKEREFLKFCRLANEEVFFFKEILRDKTMHALSHYSAAQAVGVFERVRDFMQRLAKRIPLK